MMDEEISGAPYTVEEVAQKLDVNVKTAYEAIRRKEIPSIRFGRTIRVPRPAFNELLRRGKVA
jgi:excisionase family DNA binding protein